eukprot:SAG11_NODE_18432_length_491_cov_1.188776_1_plen_113_part_10
MSVQSLASALLLMISASAQDLQHPRGSRLKRPECPYFQMACRASFQCSMFALNVLGPELQRWYTQQAQAAAAPPTSPPHGLPTYELLVLEAAMCEVCDGYERQLEVLAPVVLA